MRRIALVCEDLSVPLDEGFKKASARIAGALADLGHQVSVYTHYPAHSAVISQDLPRNKLLRGRRFSHSLKACRPDFILYIPEAAATPGSMLRARSLRAQARGAPVALLSLQYRTYSTLAHMFLKLIRPDLLLVLSSERLATMTAMGFRASRIPLGVDTEIFRPPEAGEKEALREKYGIGEDKIMVHVGHLSAGRNLKFFTRLLDEGTKVAIVTSTSTAAEPEIRALLENPSVTHIDTYVENIAEVYKLADAYAFPTFSELDAIEIPLSVLEAMAVNLPVVTTDFGGLPDLFTEGNGLFICSSEDELLSKAGEAMRLEQAGTREMVTGLTWRHVAETIMDTIESDLL